MTEAAWLGAVEANRPWRRISRDVGKGRRDRAPAEKAYHAIAYTRLPAQYGAYDSAAAIPLTAERDFGKPAAGRVRQSPCLDSATARCKRDNGVTARPLKWLSVVDEYTRECLVPRVARRLGAREVIEALAAVVARRGSPQHIRGDNGPEFIAAAIREWLTKEGVATLSIAPGSPWENGYAVSFHSRLRDELLNAEEFVSLAEAVVLSGDWQRDYNEKRPHRALGYRTPGEFARECPGAGAA